MEFNSLYELKDRVMPALKIKEEDFKKLGLNISSEQIWDYLKENKWKESTNLTLSDMVNDILKLDRI